MAAATSDEVWTVACSDLARSGGRAFDPVRRGKPAGDPMSSNHRTASEPAIPKRAAQIAQLEEKLRQLKAREQAVDARRRSLESRRRRKDDTRRKILVGAIVLAKVEQGEFAQDRLRAWLDVALTRPDDRALFRFD